MSKKLPEFKTDREAENFLDQDLSDYISAETFAPFQFEFRHKQTSVNLRISEELLNAVRAVAHRRGIPYQRYIRQTLRRHCGHQRNLVQGKDALITQANDNASP